jgi:hypothetical protein
MHAILRPTAFAFALTALMTTAAAAQTAPPSPWAPWTGCWRLMSESGVVARGADQPTVCVDQVPGGARLTTTVAGSKGLEQVILSDGAGHPVNEAECRGTQRHAWAAGGLRLYGRAELTCAGESGPRQVSSYSLLLQDGAWLDIQAVEVNGRDNIRVRRYRHVEDTTDRRPRMGRALDLDDVKDASGRVAAAAVEAAVVESRTAIPLSSKTLLELEKARVPGRVIDLLVAVAYPERFVVERSASADHGWLPPAFINDPFWIGSPWWGSAGFYNPFYSSPYYYSPFAYSSYGDGVYFGSGVPAIAGVNTDPTPSGIGRVVNGRGYTQVRPRDAEMDTRASASNRSTPRSSSGSSSSSAPAPVSSSSGGSTASSAGYSSGGSSSSSSGSSSSSSGGDSGARTAVPR